MLPQETALVTGATGFIGTHLVRRLVRQGVRTFCLVRDSARLADRREQLSGAEIIPVAFENQDQLTRVVQGLPGAVVFHLASAGVSYSRDNPADTIRVNIDLMTRLLIATAALPLRNFIYTGTCSEYGPSPGPLTEDSPLSPPTVYGASKAAAFLCGQSLARQLGVPLLGLRLFNVYGPGEAPGRLVPTLVEKLTRREPVSLTGGEQVRDLLYVADIIDALWAASRLPSVGSPTVLNVCSGVPIRIRDVGLTVARQLHASPQLLQWGEIPYRPDEPMTILGDNHRFAAATGWLPKTDLPTGLAETIDRLVGRAARRAA